MLAVEVELLTGRYTATRFNDRHRPEWPPHPARLFSALVATWADASEPDVSERAALEWMERLGDPRIACSRASERAAVTHYVPDNDTTVLRHVARLDRLYLEASALGSDPAGDVADGGAATPASVAARRDKHRAKLAAQTVKATAAAPNETPAARATALALLPEGRGRQARTYPTMVPADPRVWFGWPEAPDDADARGHRAALDGLLARVARLGHSSSLVACRLVDEMPEPSYVPDPDAGDTVLRVPAAGLLHRLELAFDQHRSEEPRSLPARLTAYRTGPATAATRPGPPNHGGEWVVLALAGRAEAGPAGATGAEPGHGKGGPAGGRRRRPRGARLPLRAALPVCRAVRAALVAHADEPVAEVISGHRPGAPGELTAPTDRPHVAVVPLPFVGHRHADGSILGVAVVLPRRELMGDDERRAVLRAVGRWRRASGPALHLPGGRRVRLELVDEPDPPYTLQPRRWRRPARSWASVTPVALDRHPGDLRHRDPSRRAVAEAAAEATIAAACVHAGLPAPSHVRISLDTPVVGVPHLRSFPPYRLPTKRVTRAIVHASLAFPHEVAGPVLLGAGRHYGYGLFLPVRDVSGAGIDHDDSDDESDEVVDRG